MKYQPPEQGAYESGLTAKLMYDLLNSLLIKNATREDARRLRDTPGLGVDKLWEIPEIRSELEEFVTSFFFSDLQPPLHGFEEMLQHKGATFEGGSAVRTAQKGSLIDYLGRLEQHYGSREKANESVSVLFGELKRRGNRMYEEIDKMYGVKGKHLRKTNAKDAFSHVGLMAYYWIELAVMDLGIKFQS